MSTRREAPVGDENPRRHSFHQEYFHLYVAAAPILRGRAQSNAQRIVRALRNIEQLLGDGQPRTPESGFGDEVIRVHGISGIRNEILEPLRMVDAREKLLGDLQQPRMLRVAVLEYIEKERAVVNAR